VIPELQIKCQLYFIPLFNILQHKSRKVNHRNHPGSFVLKRIMSDIYFIEINHNIKKASPNKRKGWQPHFNKILTTNKIYFYGIAFDRASI